MIAAPSGVDHRMARVALPSPDGVILPPAGVLPTILISPTGTNDRDVLSSACEPPPEAPLVVYLDIDGVVTTVGYQRRGGKDELDPAQVAMVAALVGEFDARVVVSSTWRVEDCRDLLVDAGLPEGCFHPDWRTSILPGSRDATTGDMLPAEEASRGDEIAEHVSRNRVTRYLVLDDVDVGPDHTGRHVRPDADRGMTERDVEDARALVADLSEVATVGSP